MSRAPISREKTSCVYEEKPMSFSSITSCSTNIHVCMHTEYNKCPYSRRIEEHISSARLNYMDKQYCYLHTMLVWYGFKHSIHIWRSQVSQPVEGRTNFSVLLQCTQSLKQSNFWVMHRRSRWSFSWSTYLLPRCECCNELFC